MNESVRPSVIAGTWYPGVESHLRKTIQQLFDAAEIEPTHEKVWGLISPHAGFPYSGATAAYGYKLIQNQAIDTVVILSPLHRMMSGRVVVNRARQYETPLGRVPVDWNFLNSLTRDIPLSLVEEDNEHSLEIQLPFLQVALGPFELIPLMIGTGDVFAGSDIAQALVSHLKGKNHIIIASSDLHHIPSYKAVVKKDRQVADALTEFKLQPLRDILNLPDCTVCGRVPISILVEAVQMSGGTRLAILHQTTSGDITGIKEAGEYTVGYLSAALY